MDPCVVIRPHPKCLLTELPDGTGVLLNLETRFYYTLNGTAVFLWKTLAPTDVDTGTLAQRLAEVFAVDRASAERDVAAVVPAMLDEGLIVRAAAAR